MLWEINFDHCCNCFHKLKKNWQCFENLLKLFKFKNYRGYFYKEFSNKKLKNNLGLLKTIEILKKSLN